MHTRPASKPLLATAALLALLVGGGPVLAVDKTDAKRMLKQYKCLNCHSVTRKKDGPAYQEIAEKYREHPSPRQALFDHLTTSPTVTVNGKEESHTPIRETDTTRINNLVDWILGL